MFVLRTALRTTHNHNVSSHVAFADLAKSFETVNHKVLTLSLSKLEAPPKFVHSVERTCKDMQIVLKIGTTKSQFG